MRTLVFRSGFVNDAGRMRDGGIACSSTLGRVSGLGKGYEPDFIQPGGVKIYSNLPPFRIPNQTSVSMQQGDAYVVIRPDLEKLFASAPLRYAITGIEGNLHTPRFLQGNVRKATALILAREGKGRSGEDFYATRCDSTNSTCITATISLAEALQFAGSGIIWTTVCSGLFGALLLLISSVIYKRSHGLGWQLRRAIKEGRIRLVYMPIVELASRRIVGAEALARWSDDEGHPISPEVFVKIAEEQGFIGEITELVIRRALDELGDLLRSDPQFSVSVNVTATDFADRKFLPMLDRSIRNAGIAPQSLVIEITESSTARREVIRDSISQIRLRGHKVYVDDFGTGYSSLAYLHELNIDAIKIDKSFTMAIGSQAVKETILPQIVSMATALGLDLIVEGVENEEQASYFVGLGKASYAQGWLLGAPGSATDLIESVKCGGGCMFEIEGANSWQLLDQMESS